MSHDAFPLPSNPNPNPPLLPKKKRNLPGTPDPDAEVIALSPHSLMATNRFICEVCNKGFQRDQNLQLHRRGHNLPWKLRQRAPGKEARRRVFVCPEPTCVHHDPARALGDLTGIKKHFSRKHGEKKWKCERCGKKYAVRSDWKAHGKTCGMREYKCDCGVVFSRKDSFITHRAFCDALTQDTASLSTLISTSSSADNNNNNHNDNLPISFPPPTPHFSTADIASFPPNNPSFPSSSISPPAAAATEDPTNFMTTMTTASAHLSATALLQKAAQMGASGGSSPSSSLFGGLMTEARKGKKEVEVFGSGSGNGATRDFLGLGGDGSVQRFRNEMVAKFGYLDSAGLDFV